MKTWLMVTMLAGCSNGLNNGPDLSAPDMAQNTTCDPTATPMCGGTLDGNWTYHGACGTVDTSALTQLCAGATVSNTMITASGTLTFSGNMLTRSATGSATGSATIPMSCLFGSSCSMIPSLLANFTTAVTASNCTTAGANCTCDLTATANAPASATYTTSGSTLTVVTTTATYNYDYCVENGVLKYKGRATNPAGAERYSYVAVKN